MSRYTSRYVGHFSPAPDTVPVFDLVIGTVKACVRAFSAYLRERRRTSRNYMQLSAMPDHILKDIGIGRSELHYQANGGRNR